MKNLLSPKKDEDGRTKTLWEVQIKKVFAKAIVLYQKYSGSSDSQLELLLDAIEKIMFLRESSSALDDGEGEAGKSQVKNFMVHIYPLVESK